MPDLQAMTAGYRPYVPSPHGQMPQQYQPQSMPNIAVYPDQLHYPRPQSHSKKTRRSASRSKHGGNPYFADPQAPNGFQADPRPERKSGFRKLLGIFHLDK